MNINPILMIFTTKEIKCIVSNSTLDLSDIPLTLGFTSQWLIGKTAVFKVAKLGSNPK